MARWYLTSRCTLQQRAVNALQADRDGQAAEFAEAYDASEMYTRIQQEIKVTPRR